MSDEIEVGLEIASDKFDANSAGWAGQVNALMTELKTFRPRKTETGVPGQKGGAAEIILALGSAGAFTALVTTVRAWLDKDKTRKVDVVVKTKTKTIKLKADAIDESTLRSILSELPEQANSGPTQ